MYVCVCYAITEDDLHAEVADGARSEHDLAERCGAGTGCGSCVERICALISRPKTDHERMPVAV